MKPVEILAHGRREPPPIPPRPERTLVERIKWTVTEPAATEPTGTALPVWPLMMTSAEIEKLCRGGSASAEQYPRRDYERYQRSASANGALFWHVGHALLPR